MLICQCVTSVIVVLFVILIDMETPPAEHQPTPDIPANAMGLPNDAEKQSRERRIYERTAERMRRQRVAGAGVPYLSYHALAVSVRDISEYVPEEERDQS